jgi:hypothetical protein
MSKFTTASWGCLPPNGRRRSEGLLEEDGYLAVCNLGDLKENSGIRETYWLLAIQAAWEASRLEGIRILTVADHNTR